jgi:hypothetical protein
LKSLHCRGHIDQGLQIETGAGIIDSPVPLLSEVREQWRGGEARTSESGTSRETNGLKPRRPRHIRLGACCALTAVFADAIVPSCGAVFSKEKV